MKPLLPNHTIPTGCTIRASEISEEDIRDDWNYPGHTGATRLYERLGMCVTQRHELMQKPLR